MKTDTCYCRNLRCQCYGGVGKQARLVFRDWHDAALRFRCTHCDHLIEKSRHAQKRSQRQSMGLRRESRVPEFRRVLPRFLELWVKQGWLAECPRHDVANHPV